jgi:hypothetical protein
MNAPPESSALNFLWVVADIPVVDENVENAQKSD